MSLQLQQHKWIPWTTFLERQPGGMVKQRTHLCCYFALMHPALWYVELRVRVRVRVWSWSWSWSLQHTSYINTPTHTCIHAPPPLLHSETCVSQICWVLTMLSSTAYYYYVVNLLRLACDYIHQPIRIHQGVSTEVPDGGGYGGADAGAGAADGGGGGASAREAAFASVAPLTQAAAEWTCAACTFLNPPEAPLCGVCETMKSEDPRSAHQQQEEEEEAPPSSSHELPPSTIYVSRLDSVRLAVDSHLARVAQTHPYHRVGVVVFNDTVAVIGDGTQPTLKIGGDVLLDYDMLFNLGVRAAGTSKAGVAESRGRLMARMQEIESQGQTALGPALLVAVAMCNNAPRSQVMLCTDGLSNVGLGGLAPDATPLEMEYADGFFTRVAETAASQGTTISVISIRGDECNLNSLGVLADMTGGSVARVDALQLSQSIAAIEAPRPQASNVRVRILMHTSLAPFVGGKLMPAMDGLNSHQKRLGNVNAQTQVGARFCDFWGLKRPAPPPPPPEQHCALSQGP